MKRAGERHFIFIVSDCYSFEGKVILTCLEVMLSWSCKGTFLQAGTAVGQLWTKRYPDILEIQLSMK